jgi:transposase
MNIDLTKARVFIRPGHTDLRKAVNGLSVIIERGIKGEVFSGDLYLFCNRDRKLLKAIWWDTNGFWLSQKRLEKEKYPWPQTMEAVMELSSEQLLMLLAGIDFFKAHKTLYYKKVS